MTRTGTRGWSRRHDHEVHVEVVAERLIGADAATIASDCGCHGRVGMSSFQGLSGGNTCSAARMRSASGVSNISGFWIRGIDIANERESTTLANATAAEA